MHVLSVSSLKGGVGKTTVTLGLASAAFARGVRTLVVGAVVVIAVSLFHLLRTRTS